MATKERTVPAGEFKSKCIALIEEVAESGQPVVVTKEGKPVAKLVPFKKPRPLLGSVLWEDDIVSPVGEAWDAES